MELVLIRGLPGSGRRPWRACLRWLATNTTKPTTTLSATAPIGLTRPSCRSSRLVPGSRWAAFRGAPGAWLRTRSRGAGRCNRLMDTAKAAGVPVRVIEARGQWANCHGGIG